MITISACMIVKNEERVLRRCLDSLKGLYDELVIVDTGSSDSTVSIAKEYTDKVYDFEWIDDFSAARNFAMSKCSMEYIYIPDADEVLDEENRERFKLLKENLYKEIEVVEMWYVNQLSNGTVYNYDRELRPKLYKRLREFTFIDPVHEIVRVDPVVYESEVEIIHKPETLHTNRDLRIFEKIIDKGDKLSDRLTRMYARELCVSGKEEDFIKAAKYFERLLLTEESDELQKCAYIVLAYAAAVTKDTDALLKYTLKNVVTETSSEICTILGAFFEEKGDLLEASIWYFNARYETEPELLLKSKTVTPLRGLIRVYKALGDVATASKYEEELKDIDSFIE